MWIRYHGRAKINWQPASSGVFYWEERLPRVFAHQLRSGVTTNNDQLILKLYVSWFFATFQLIESMVVYDINYYDIKLYILNSLVESFHHFVTNYVKVCDHFSLVERAALFRTLQWQLRRRVGREIF